MDWQIVFTEKEKVIEKDFDMDMKIEPTESIVTVKNLTVTGKDGRLLVDHLSLQLRRGETLGLVGESGSGKTLTLKSLMNLLPSTLTEQHDEKTINGNAAMIFQNPMSALDPLCPVLSQLTEVVMVRQNVSKGEARLRAEKLLKRLPRRGSGRRADADGQPDA